MTTTAFPPEISPVSRSFQQGRWPTKQFVAMNGATTTRLYGNNSTEATLDLEFIVNDEQMEDILSCYRRSYGSYGIVSLSDEMFDGTSDNVFPDYLKWHWSEAPSVSSVQPDLSRVKVKLIGLLEA